MYYCVFAIVLTNITTIIITITFLSMNNNAFIIMLLEIQEAIDRGSPFV